MLLAIQGLQVLLSIVALVCYILVVVQMFQRGQTGLGIACIVLFFCAFLGVLIAFIYGWVKAGEWGITNIMMIWTACIVISFILGGVAFALAPAGQPAFPQLPRG